MATTTPPGSSRDNPKDQPATYEPLSADMIKGVYKNLGQDVIYITDDRAFRYLEPWKHKLQHSGDWLGRLSLVCTLTLTLVTVDFKPRFSISSEHWLSIFEALTIVSVFWLLRTLYARLFLKIETVEDMIERFKNLPPPSVKLSFWDRIKAYYSIGHSKTMVPK
ncbi:MAG TPA: hypothetical protein VGP62_02920 [Bryobacteraceae bacterium]|jgi:hypothetical protein|nr:hypothetical protein [Bryobacteraceae bacterium]